MEKVDGLWIHSQLNKDETRINLQFHVMDDNHHVQISNEVWLSPKQARIIMEVLRNSLASVKES
jgi:ABC-type Zn2+ transport system substrate-binding protein/surface adhesin